LFLLVVLVLFVSKAADCEDTDLLDEGHCMKWLFVVMGSYSKQVLKVLGVKFQRYVFEC
jgi:hypothetical protein